MEDARRLLDAGFLQMEVEEFANAITPSGASQKPIDLDSPVWKRVLESRRSWVQSRIEENWTDVEIEKELLGYYKRDKKRTAWDFLKIEYRSPTKIDYIEAARMQKRNKIENSLGEYK